MTLGISVGGRLQLSLEGASSSSPDFPDFRAVFPLPLGSTPSGKAVYTPAALSAPGLGDFSLPRDSVLNAYCLLRIARSDSPVGCGLQPLQKCPLPLSAEATP